MTNTNPVFITGDRMLAVPYLLQVPVEVVKAVAAGRPIQTGTNTGVEQLVRELASEAGVEVQVIEHSLIEGTTWGDWDARHASLGEDVEVVAIHVDPMSDTLTKMLLASKPDTRLVIAGV